MSRLARHQSILSFAVSSAIVLASTGLLFSSRYTPPPAHTRPALKPTSAVRADATGSPERGSGFGQLPLIFEKNEGQADSRFQFLVRGGGYAMLFSRGNLLLRFRREGVPARQAEQLSIGMRLKGSNPAPDVEGLERLPGLSHYFIGSDPRKWHTNVPQYRKVRYRGVYPGVDVVYYDNHRRLEYDFEVAPGADPRAIKLAFDGVDRLRLDSGGNLILAAAGQEFRQAKPVVRQTIGGRIRQVPVRYEIAGGTGEVTLALANYDRTQALIVDPVLDFFSYLGSSRADYGNFMTVDSSGNILMTGFTDSTLFANATAFPTKGPIPFMGPEGSGDAFITRFGTDQSGNMVLLSSTILGGSGLDQGFGIALDPGNNIYLVGETNSPDFPAQSSGVYQSKYPAISAGTYTGFAVKLNSGASAIVYSTYLGVPLPASFGAAAGSGDDHAYAVAVDSNLNAYIAGKTSAGRPFPTAPEQLRSCGTSQAYAGYVLKLNPAGSTVLYSTLLTGTNGGTCAMSVAVDSTGAAYAAGNDNATDLLTRTAQLSNTAVAPAFQSQYGGGSMDMFVAKLAPSGVPSYLSFLGGNGVDSTTTSTLAVDGSGNAYITGGTISSNLPASAGALQPGLHSHTPCPLNGDDPCGYDAFVAKINPSGTQLQGLTYLGGSTGDYAAGLALDTRNNVYVTGFTQSPDFPSPLRLQPQVGSGSIFVTEVKSDLTQSLYTTYFGGNGQVCPTPAGNNGVCATSVAIRPQTNDLYVAGVALGESLPSVPTKGPAISLYPGYQGGISDAFFTKLTSGKLRATGTMTRTVVAAALPVTIAGHPATPASTVATPLSPVTFSMSCQTQNAGNTPVDNPTSSGHVCSTCQVQGAQSSDPSAVVQCQGTACACTSSGTMPGGGSAGTCTIQFTTTSDVAGTCDPSSDTHDTDAGSNSPTVAPPPDFEIDTLPVSGLQVNVDGTPEVSAWSGYWLPTASHILSAITPQCAQGSPCSVRFSFASWTLPTGPVLGNSVPASVTTDTVLSHFTANFTTQYRLDLSSSPSTCPSPVPQPPAADNFYDAGSTVVLTAQSCAGIPFQGWSVTNASACAGQGTCTITMPGPAGNVGSPKVTANYGTINNPTPTSEIGIFRGGSPFAQGGFILNKETSGLTGGYNFTTASADGKIGGAEFGIPGDIPVAGDWNGTGVVTIGVFRNGAWLLDLNNNGKWDGTAGGDGAFNFGVAGDRPVVGDWNGDGRSKFGVFRPGNAIFILDFQGVKGYDPNTAKVYSFGVAGDLPVAGNWGGPGTPDRIGIFRPGTGQWVLDSNGSGNYESSDAVYNFGTTGDVPVVGLWGNSPGQKRIGIYRPSSGAWILDTTGTWNWTGADLGFQFGTATDLPIVGLWTF